VTWLVLVVSQIVQDHDLLYEEAVECDSSLFPESWGAMFELGQLMSTIVKKQLRPDCEALAQI
jgi:hypothetical protein